MDNERFWELVEQSLAAALDTSASQAQALERLLSRESRDDLEDFARIYSHHHSAAYTWKCWGAGYVINVGMSDALLCTSGIG
jgi:hypothetical protein